MALLSLNALLKDRCLELQAGKQHEKSNVEWKNNDQSRTCTLWSCHV